MLSDILKSVVKLAQKQAFEITDDEESLKVQYLYPDWKSGVAYSAGDRRNHKSILYKCITAHTSQDDWTPDAAPSLWAKVLIPDANVIPEWEQPESTNGYNKGDKVTHNGKTWISTVDVNIWEPGVYGWDEVTSE